jgi:uncharacterized membrane protein (UPF0182 family)
MYTIALIVLVGLGVWLAVHGVRSRKFGLTAVGILLTVAAGLYFGLLDFWGEMLWFEAMGYGRRFWEALWVQILSGLAGAVFGAAFIYLLTTSVPRKRRLVRVAGAGLGALIGLLQGAPNWETILKFIHRTPTKLPDPIFEKPVGFYLFQLPFYDLVYHSLLIFAIIALAAAAVAIFVSIQTGGEVGIHTAADEKGRSIVFRCSGALLLVLALGKYLDRYHLMYSEVGVVTGPGWTDIHVRLPALIIVVLLLILCALFLMIHPLRRRLQRRLDRIRKSSGEDPVYTLGAVALFIAGVWILGLSLVPGLFQWLRVEPNEITFEEPYIANNIEFTRHGFNLHRVEEREFPAVEQFDRSMIEKNRQIFDNIRLWDWRALDAVYKQFQEIRLYYEFFDVDVDRYTTAGQYIQAMISAREMEIANLPEQSQTFVNRRFKYTHGYGITLTGVSKFTPQGLPDLLIKDIPPQSRYPELKVERPQIYYGELTNHPAVVNTREKEFDYPMGDENVYIQYPGSGGVQLKNYWWRKFVYGWKFDGMRLFLSGYPTPESRIMFHRQIEDRVQTLAPFLTFDEDPYIVLADGKLYWIIDAYTTTSYFPYSERFSGIRADTVQPERRRLMAPRRSQKRGFTDINYVRNSVKAVVDAFNGTVTFYVFDESDPIVQTWRSIFPELFRSREDMPENLATHVRYPKDLLLIQGLVYSKYHMTDPTVFYNQEDLWVRATEKYYNNVQPVEPYYIMWELPGSDEPEFVVMLPFTPKNRQVSIGWIAGMCDGSNYGRLLAYKFPKEKRVLGPQQVETKIDQDSFLSGQLTLWDQRGSRVIRGNVLAIPIEGTLLYVEPIYLQAETAAYPELRLVAVMHNDDLSYAETFEKALEGLFTGQPPKAEAARETAPAGIKLPVDQLIRRANEAFQNYLRFLGEKKFARSSQALEQLESTLQELSQEAGTSAAGQQETQP